jgi:hypothetical protein
VVNGARPLLAVVGERSGQQEDERDGLHRPLYMSIGAT